MWLLCVFTIRVGDLAVSLECDDVNTPGVTNCTLTGDNYGCYEYVYFSVYVADPKIELPLDLSFCEGDNIPLSAYDYIGTFSYLELVEIAWYVNGSLDTITTEPEVNFNLSAGEYEVYYTVEIYNLYASAAPYVTCESNTIDFTVSPLESINLSYSDTICLGDSIYLEVLDETPFIIGAHIWNIDGQKITHHISDTSIIGFPVLVLNSEDLGVGEHHFSFRFFGGYHCFEETAGSFVIEDCAIMSVKNISDLGNFQLYVNNKTLYGSFKNPLPQKNLHFSLFSIAGNLIKTSPITTNNTFTINLDEVELGIYIYHLSTNAGTILASDKVLVK